MFNQSNSIKTLKDDTVLADLIGKNPTTKNNFIVVRDRHTGKVLLTRRNLVVRRGREFNLRKIFHIPYNGDTQANLDARFINLFGIGSGGTPSGDPFNPLAPSPADIGLSKEVPFRVYPEGTILSEADRKAYSDKRTSGGNDSYYKKTFSNRDIIMDDENDDYYVKLTLDITELDARGALVSELSLFSAIKVGDVFSNYNMATRVTFQTEGLSVQTNKGLVIEYYVYA